MHLPARAHYIALPAWRLDQQTSAADLGRAFGHRVDRFLINIKFQVKFCFFNGARGRAGQATNTATTGNARTLWRHAALLNSRAYFNSRSLLVILRLLKGLTDGHNLALFEF
jgi:hypothetical protein